MLHHFMKCFFLVERTRLVMRHKIVLSMRSYHFTAAHVKAVPEEAHNYLLRGHVVAVGQLSENKLY